MTIAPVEKPKRRSPRRPRVPKAQSSRDIDLTGFYRLDLKTFGLILMLAAQWWDDRAQAARREELDELRSAQVAEKLDDVKKLQNVQQYDIRAIITALAENGIKVPKQ